MSAFRKIVMATDFSATSEDALDAAVSFARDTGAEVHLVYVVPDPLTQPWMIEGAGLDFMELRRAWTEDAEREMKRLAESRALDPKQFRHAVLVGAPAGEIIQYAADHHADLIVLGSHGHGAVRRFLLGSVADKVLRSAGCPVLVVPHRTLRIPANVTDVSRHTAAPIVS